MALDKPLEQIQEADLQALKTDGEREGRMLDYKRETYGVRDQDKLELCADVTSFANTVGGHIILGMDETAGLPTSVDGLAGLDADKEMLRLQQILRSGTQPRLSAVAMHPVTLASGAVCIVIRIPRSWARPHAVANGDWLRWFARNSNGKYKLDVPEIKSAFLLSETIAERMRALRVDRIAAIEAGDTPVPIPGKPRLIYHFLPADAFEPGVVANLDSVAVTNHLSSPSFQFAPFKKFNFDGLCFYEDTGSDETLRRNSYVQVYETGVVEAVIARDLPAYTTSQSKILGLQLESQIIQHVNQLRGGLDRMNVPLPTFLFFSIIGVQGRSLFASQWGFEDIDPSVIDRDPLLFAEVMLDEESLSTERFLKPLLDRLWRASGWRGSPSYSSEGEWDDALRDSAWKRQA